MHLISFDASPRQVGKLRNGHSVRIKKGTGFNLVVHPTNYQLVSRAFSRNKGVELQLSPEELETNRVLSPEQQAELTSSMDNTLFKAEGGSIFSKVNKALHSKTAKRIGRELKPFSRALKATAKDYLHDQLAQAHMAGMDQYGEDPRMAMLMNNMSSAGHQKIQGFGLGAGLYAGRGMNVHEALRLANMATANANNELAKMHNASVHGQLTQPPLRRYWDEDLAPPSRGNGMTNHYNMIRGRGSMISQDHMLPPALQSQPYGANWHMQFFLPPQYHKFNDGTDMEGRGIFM
jgi:hypothetical protein